jgi:hypothetical protein
MRLKNPISVLSALFILIYFTSCEKETEVFESETIDDYMPLAVNKYIVYRLDSTVFTNQGRNEEIHKYQVKYEVESQQMDNAGRPSFRVFRYITDSAGTQPWAPNGTFFITPLADQAEVIEDNLRFIKLHLPLKTNVTWKGNKYLTSDPYASLFQFSNDDNMNEWDYDYEQYEASITIDGKTINDVYTVTQIDEALNAPVTDTRSYGARSLGIEKYAKNIGLVYREYILWEYQPNTGGSGGGYKTGFGIKMWMIDHN